MQSRWSKAARVLLAFLAVVAAGFAWYEVSDRVYRAIAQVELTKFGGGRLVFEVDLDRGLRDEADRLAVEMEELAREAVPGATARVRRGAQSEIEVAFADVTAAQRFAQAVPTEVKKSLAQAGGPPADRELRFVLGDPVRDQLLERLRGRIASRLERFTGHTVLVHSEGSRLFADLPPRALAQLERLQRGRDTLQRLFIPARLEFKVVDDSDQTLARLTPLPPEVTLEWDRYQGPGGALVTAPYLTSSDGQALRALIREMAPAERVFAISLGLDAAGKYRTFLLHERAGLTGEYVTDARAAFDGSGDSPRPYVSVTFNKRGARLFGSLTAGNVSRRLAIVLDGQVDSAPIIQTAITEGVCSIHLGGVKPIQEVLQEAKDLSLLLRSGALAAPVRLIAIERIPARQ